jgi:hypothetical protein
MNSVSVSGNRVVVGEVGRDESSGQVYVFLKNADSDWEPSVFGYVTPEAGLEFGFSVSISGDIIAIVLGSPGNEIAGMLMWDGEWHIQILETVSPFGTTVAVSSDGVVLVGALETSGGSGLDGCTADLADERYMFINMIRQTATFPKNIASKDLMLPMMEPLEPQLM